MTTPRRFFTDAEHARIVAMLADGCNNTEIARALGRPVGSISGYIQRNELAPPRRGHYNRQAHAQVIDLYRQGAPLAEIALAVGYSEEHVEYVLRRHQEPRNRYLRCKPAVLAFILAYKAETQGGTPSVREIGDAVGISSTSAVKHNLKLLEADGCIELHHNGQARDIRIPGAVWVPPQEATP